MSKLTTTSVVKNDVVKSNVAAHASVPVPVLITEHDHPARLTFLETSLMSREMYRL